MKTERELFEAWAKKETNWDLYWSENIKQYMDHQTNGAWFAWIASAQREGCKFVPVEPPEDMDIKICRLVDHRIDVFEADQIYKAMIGAAP